MLLNEDMEVVRPGKGTRAHREFMMRCLDETEDDFLRILHDMAIDDPKFFMRTRMDISRLVMPRQQEVNVNLTLNEDFQELQALASRGIDSKLLVDKGGIEEIEAIEEDDGGEDW